MQLAQIVPWGRSRREYELMFDLAPSDRLRRILGCGDGPASFNAEWTTQGGQVVSCDPIYQFTAVEIQERFDATVPVVMAQVHQQPLDYVWSFHRNPADLLETRQAAFSRFVADYPAGLRQGRYVADELPKLKFPDNSFDLALCSHLLFLYSDALSFEFHLHSIVELVRVAREVRIFPLVDLRCELSRHLAPVQSALRARGLNVTITHVRYQLQRNGNEMMRVSSSTA